MPGRTFLLDSNKLKLFFGIVSGVNTLKSVNLASGKQISRHINTSNVMRRKAKAEEPSIEEENISESIENEDTEENEFSSQLTKWAIHHNISWIAFSRLLQVLKEYNVAGLPRSSKTILQARESKIKTISVPPGTYTHYGLEKNLKTLITKLAEKNMLKSPNIKLSIFIDNIILKKFTNYGLWTILGSILGFNKIVFLIGSYHGNTKPNNSNLFLKEFVNEAKNLCENGLVINKVKYNISMKRLVCDAPAKAFVLNIKNCSGYSSCTKCDTVGEYRSNKICFPDKASPRVDKDFEMDSMYQKEKTKLLEIPNFGAVSSVPLDYLHLVCIGVVKQLIGIWLDNTSAYWESDGHIASTGDHMNSIAEFCPMELHAKPKQLAYYLRWDSSQFRQFLLYQGPIVLSNNLHKKYYNHFLALHAACRLMCMKENQFEGLGRDLLNQFIKDLIVLYGKEQMTHNAHGLYHLADDYKLHGTLDSFSTFPYEIFLLKMRNSIRRAKKRCIPQLILRNSHEKLFMKSLDKVSTGKLKIYKKRKAIVEPVPDEFKDLDSYEILKMKNFEIILENKGDVYVLLESGKIVEVTNILMKKNKTNKDYFISGKEFKSVTSFYKEPIDSALVNIFLVKDQSDSVNVWPVNSINKKCMKMPINKKESVMAALLDEDF